jgi:hypothetical protein
MSFSDHLRKVAQPIWDAQLAHPFVVALGKGTLPERKFKYYILQDARFLGDLARVFSAAAMRAPASDEAGRGNHCRRTQPPRRVRVTVEDERQTNDGGAHGADELRLHQAHAHRRPYGLGSGDHRRRTPLRLDLLRRRAASLETGPAKTESSLPGLAHALRLTRVCRGATLDEEQSRSVGQDGWQRRKEANGRVVRRQFAI